MLNMKLINRDTEGELQLIGRLDTTTAADAEAHMVQAGERFETLILDMAQLEYVSSAGLRALKRVHVTMRRKGGSLMVKNVTKPVMEVFEITGFAGMLKFI